MYYEIYGNGTIPLVLIHGGGSTIETTFGNILPLLPGKLIAVELQAHGRTGDRDAPESFEQDADDVAALLNYLKIDKANFFGFSNGGTTTLQIALRHPGLINKIVVASAIYQREGMIPGFFDGMANATLNDMPGPLKEAYLKVAPVKNNLQVMFEKDRQRMLNFKDYSDDHLRAIKAATLLMVADHDVITTSHVLKMSQLIPNAQLVVLPGTHGSFIGELGTIEKGSRFPGITAALIEEFLNN
ncbi:MAG: alpha/beta hydrolase [Bacteroidota bacterium]|nr:alpha/beta hydrolase [Bacteroidota bacterium]